MVDDGCYCLRSVRANKYLNQSKSAGSARLAKVQLWGSRGVASQWLVTCVRANIITLQNLFGALWLNKKGSHGARNGAIVQMCNNPQSPDSQFLITRYPDGTVTLQGVSSGKYLNSGGDADGAVVQMWDGPSNRDNRWILEPISQRVPALERPVRMAGGKCQFFLVPSRPDQIALEDLGVDTQRVYNGFSWGGAHISVGNSTGYNDARRGQMSTAARAGMGINMRSANWRRSWKNAGCFNFAVTSQQAIGKLRDAAEHARGAGWNGVRTQGFHCTAFVRSEGRGRGDQIGDVLRDAQWGFVLTVQTSHRQRCFDWSSFMPV